MACAANSGDGGIALFAQQVRQVLVVVGVAHVPLLEVAVGPQAEPIRQEPKGECWHDAAVTTDALAPLSDLPGVFEAADGVRAAVDGLLREPALATGEGRDPCRVAQASGLGVARLEGAMISLEEFEPPFADDQTGRLCASSLRISGEVGALSDTWRRAPLQALAKPSHSGRGRRCGTRCSRTTPPGPRCGGQALRNRRDGHVDQRARSCRRCGSCRGSLLDVAPFGWGDGLVARAASRLVLVASGVDPDALTVPEEGLLELGARALCGGADGVSDGNARRHGDVAYSRRGIGPTGRDHRSSIART